MAVPCVAGGSRPDGGQARATQGEPQPVIRLKGDNVIRGFVLDAGGQSVPDVPIRLREVSTGRVQDLRRAGSAGEFTFEQVPPGRYVVEVLDEDGRVIAIGQSFTVPVDPGAELLVRLRGKLKGTSLLFSSVAASIISAAAAIGFAAVAPAGQSVSPER